MQKQIIKIHLQPNAKRNQVCGLYNNDYIKIAITAPAIDGKANKALIDFLAIYLKIAKSKIEITKGFTCRDKILEIECEEEITKKLKTF
jgi:uncharacterized protein (TIGR00251 family)